MSGDAAAESIELVEDNQTPADALPLGGPTTVDRPKLTSVPIPTLASRNPPDTTTTTTTTAAPITPADAPPAPVPSMPQTPQAPQPPATNPQTAATTPAPIPEIVPIPVTPTSASPRTTQAPPSYPWCEDLGTALTLFGSSDTLGIPDDFQQRLRIVLNALVQAAASGVEPTSNLAAQFHDQMAIAFLKLEPGGRGLGDSDISAFTSNNGQLIVDLFQSASVQCYPGTEVAKIALPH